jgi:hypothetical protein
VDRCNDHGQTPLGGGDFKGYEAIASVLLQQGRTLTPTTA